MIASKYTGAALYHSHGCTGEGVTIAIVDTGVFPHEDLTLLPGWGTGGLDPAEDEHGHGTHVAGIAAGKQYGVAPGASILPVRISKDGTSNTVVMAAALEWLIQWKQAHGERLVVNISFTGTESENVRDGINKLVAMDVPVVVAAGNTGGELAEIAEYDAPVVVANLSLRGKWNGTSSCRGAQTDCATIGTEVYSCKTGGGYCYMSGTSMAAPAVAGMLALILSRWPEMSEADAYKELMKTGIETLVSCKDGKHSIPHVSFEHVQWIDGGGDDVRESRTVAGVKTGYKLTVRKEASNTAERVGYVKNGDKVVALRTDGAWREIVFAPYKRTARLGWVNDKYLEGK